MVRVLKYWAGAGFLIPVVITIVAEVEPKAILSMRLDLVALALWPSSIFMMGLHESGAFSVLVLAVSIAANIFLYSVVGAMLWLVFNRRFKADQET